MGRPILNVVGTIPWAEGPDTEILKFHTRLIKYFVGSVPREEIQVNISTCYCCHSTALEDHTCYCYWNTEETGIVKIAVCLECGLHV